MSAHAAEHHDDALIVGDRVPHRKHAGETRTPRRRDVDVGRAMRECVGLDDVAFRCDDWRASTIGYRILE